MIPPTLLFCKMRITTEESHKSVQLLLRAKLQIMPSYQAFILRCEIQLAKLTKGDNFRCQRPKNKTLDNS